jgi:phytoene dehydrogenase-like protein
METKFDIIIIGAGPNGLQAGAYLSKAGEKVLVLERRYECGGGLWTEETTFPGFFHSTHAIYMMMADFAPVYNDFELEQKYGVHHIHPDLVWTMPFEDGKSLCVYKDVERTCRSIAQFSQKDAETYLEFYNFTKKCVDEFIGPATYMPPAGALDQIVLLQKLEFGAEMGEWSEMNALEIINRKFENDRVKAMILYLTTHWGVRYDMNALGYLVLLYFNRAHNYQLVKGGSHMVAQALNKVIHENKGLVKNNQRIKRIIVESNEARGVEMENGVVYEAAKAIISTIDPQQTFLDLVGEENINHEPLVNKVKNWEWEAYSLLGVHSALDEQPRFSAAAANPDVDNAEIYILGYESLSDLTDYIDAVYDGQIPSKLGFNCCFPSMHDPSLAPEGRCVSQISAMMPHDLKEGGVDPWYQYKFRHEMADKCLDVLERYAPNITGDKVLQTHISTPVDCANMFVNMKKGSIKQGMYQPLQMGFLRPHEDCSHHRTPVKNLYLGGSSVYPGGCVIWGPGYLAANRVAEDYSIAKWWQEPEGITKLKDLGF